MRKMKLLVIKPIIATWSISQAQRDHRTRWELPRNKWVFKPPSQNANQSSFFTVWRQCWLDINHFPISSVRFPAVAEVPGIPPYVIECQVVQLFYPVMTVLLSLGWGMCKISWNSGTPKATTCHYWIPRTATHSKKGRRNTTEDSAKYLLTKKITYSRTHVQYAITLFDYYSLRS
jgi:hypothetical protein